MWQMTVAVAMVLASATATATATATAAAAAPDVPFQLGRTPSAVATWTRGGGRGRGGTSLPPLFPLVLCVPASFRSTLLHRTLRPKLFTVIVVFTISTSFQGGVVTFAFAFSCSSSSFFFFFCFSSSSFSSFPSTFIAGSTLATETAVVRSATRT
jgi:hypothetical protein